jgi:hypothetical protein
MEVVKRDLYLTRPWIRVLTRLQTCSHALPRIAVVPNCLRYQLFPGLPWCIDENEPASYIE